MTMNLKNCPLSTYQNDKYQRFLRSTVEKTAALEAERLWLQAGPHFTQSSNPPRPSLPLARDRKADCPTLAWPPGQPSAARWPQTGPRQQPPCCKVQTAGTLKLALLHSHLCPRGPQGHPACGTRSQRASHVAHGPGPPPHREARPLARSASPRGQTHWMLFPLANNPSHLHEVPT